VKSEVEVFWVVMPCNVDDLIVEVIIKNQFYGLILSLMWKYCGKLWKTIDRLSDE
jgi:hypothetical protein